MENSEPTETPFLVIDVGGGGTNVGEQGLALLDLCPPMRGCASSTLFFNNTNATN